MYTTKEINVILQEVRNNPSNLQAAFRSAGEQIGRTAHTVQQKWYKSLRHSKEAQFVLTSIVGSKTNTKNVPVRDQMGNITIKNGEFTYKGITFRGDLVINL